MKISLVCDSKQKLGGGFTFRRNLAKGLKQLGHDVIEDYRTADVVVVSGVTMVDRATIKDIKTRKIKLVVRLDNVPRNSRNRNTGTSRLRDFTILANAVVYQSEWAKEYLVPFINREGAIIHNGVDTDIFYRKGSKIDFKGNPVYLYSRFNRDETKRWENAWYEYQMIQRRNPKAKLVIVGNFSPDMVQYNFDFFMGENYEYMGIVDSQERMAQIYRSCDYLLATYYNDCYSNTYCEAIACGCQLYRPDMSGGTPEVIEQGVISLEEMAEKYVLVFEDVLRRGGD
jgi:glycosyltransferase involved in cell wall biosynthesis